MTEIGYWERFFKTKKERETLSRKEEKDRVLSLPHDERREHLREIPGQFYEVVKLDFNGRGTNRTLDKEVEEEPTAEYIASRWYDRWGGGSYKIYSMKPWRVPYRTVEIEGDSVTPESGGGGSDPKKRLYKKMADSISSETLAALAPGFFAKELGIAAPHNPFMIQGPEQQLKISIAQTLFQEGKHEAAAAILNGGKVKTETELTAFMGFLKTLSDLQNNPLIGGSQKSERAQEIEAIALGVEKVADTIGKRVENALEGTTSDDDDDDDKPQRVICARCRKDLPSADIKKCPHCGLVFGPAAAALPPPQDSAAPAPAAPRRRRRRTPTPEEVEAEADEAEDAEYEDLSEDDDDDDDDEDDEELDPDDPINKLGRPARKPERAAPQVVTIPKLSKGEKEFLYRAVPFVFYNRIRRHNGQQFDKRFALASKVVGRLSKGNCAPGAAARIDVDFLEKRVVKEQSTKEDMVKAHDAAKMGFAGYLGRYQVLIDDQIHRLDDLARKWDSIGTKAFMAKYTSVNRHDIRDLKSYLQLKRAWDYFQLDHAKQWWEEYCAAFTQILEANHPDIWGLPSGGDTNGTTGTGGGGATSPAETEAPADDEGSPPEAKDGG